MRISKLKSILLLVICAFLVIYSLNSPKSPSQMHPSINDTSFWDDILSVSFEQKLISRETIFKTIKFMIKDVSNDDPELIEFVRSLILKPSNKKIVNMNEYDADRSQLGQSKYIDDLLNSKQNGFFIEAGAFDGIDNSNTYFFEVLRGWTGLLIEPIPSMFDKVLKLERNAFAINACISSKTLLAKFKILHVLSGRQSEMSKNQIYRLKKESQGSNGYPLTAYVPCFSIHTILKAINITKVDYFSLDVEGGEVDVIQSIPFDKLDIKTFTIEWNNDHAVKEIIVNKMTKHGYQLLKENIQDLYFIKN